MTTKELDLWTCEVLEYNLYTYEVYDLWAGNEHAYNMIAVFTYNS